MYVFNATKHLVGEIRSNYRVVGTEVKERDSGPAMVREEIDSPDTDIEATNLQVESHGLPWNPRSSRVRNANKRREPIPRQIINNYRGN